MQRTFTIITWLVRLAWCCALLPYLNTWTAAIVAAELLGLTLAVVNFVRAKTWSDSPVACCLYLAKYAMLPSAPAPAALALLTIGHLACYWAMQDCYSAGAHNFCRLVERGPFKIIRHPMTLLAIVGRCLALAAWPGPWNAACLALTLILSVVLVFDEERFLATVSDWREYRQRVRWRLLPGVW